MCLKEHGGRMGSEAPCSAMLQRTGMKFVHWHIAQMARWGAWQDKGVFAMTQMLADLGQACSHGSQHGTAYHPGLHWCFIIGTLCQGHRQDLGLDECFVQQWYYGMKTLQPGIYDLYKASHSHQTWCRMQGLQPCIFDWRVWLVVLWLSRNICVHTSSGDPTTLMLARTLGNSSSTTSLPATSCDSTTAVKASTAATCIVLIQSQIFQQSSKATLDSRKLGIQLDGKYCSMVCIPWEIAQMLATRHREDFPQQEMQVFLWREPAQGNCNKQLGKIDSNTNTNSM